jgi:hypothetical protein
MIVRMIVKHVSSGLEYYGDASDEITEKEFEEMKDYIKNHLSSITYLELNNTILPGDFIRNNCVIIFRILE